MNLVEIIMKNINNKIIVFLMINYKKNSVCCLLILFCICSNLYSQASSNSVVVKENKYIVLQNWKKVDKLGLLTAYCQENPIPAGSFNTLPPNFCISGETIVKIKDSFHKVVYNYLPEKNLNPNIAAPCHKCNLGNSQKKHSIRGSNAIALIYRLLGKIQYKLVNNKISNIKVYTYKIEYTTMPVDLGKVSCSPAGGI